MSQPVLCHSQYCVTASTVSQPLCAANLLSPNHMQGQRLATAVCLAVFIAQDKALHCKALISSPTVGDPCHRQRSAEVSPACNTPAGQPVLGLKETSNCVHRPDGATPSASASRHLRNFELESELHCLIWHAEQLLHHSRSHFPCQSQHTTSEILPPCRNSTSPHAL